MPRGFTCSSTSSRSSISNGLLQHAERAVLDRLGDQLLEAEAGHQHDLGVGLDLAELEEGLDAVHARQLHVHEDDVEIGLAEAREPGLAAEGELGLVAAHRQNVGDAFGVVAVVVDDEHAHGHAAISFCDGCSAAARRPACLCRAADDDLDRAAMLLDDLLHRRQAEAGAEALGAEQRLEHLGQHVGRDAGPGIRDHELEPVRRARRVRTVIERSARRRRIAPSPGRRCRQIDDDAAHALGIEADAVAVRRRRRARSSMPSGRRCSFSTSSSQGSASTLGAAAARACG